MRLINLPLYALPRHKEIPKTYLQMFFYKSKSKTCFSCCAKEDAEMKKLLLAALQSSGRVHIKNLFHIVVLLTFSL